MAVVHGISVHEAMSGVFGSISLTAWICLLLPQLLTNYRAQSAEGLSMPFLLIWLFGDIANLCGALATGIAPTATALAAYFCFSDLVLISQCLYYNTRNARRARQRAASNATDASEDEPLLRRRRASSGAALPGSQRRNSMRHEESGFDPIRRVVTGEDETPDSNPALHNALSVAAVYIVGTLGWFISYKAGAWDAPESPDLPAAKSAVAIVGMSLGYLSAVCYLCARIPQIIKNYREKSCEGLALLFFLLSLTGNLTYGASVFSYSQTADDIIKAVPWLLGSLGTMVEDCIIFYQFSVYAPKREPPKTNGAV
ncbi:vacuolar membrane pq loop repeat protein [Apiospora aurea]|uniref:Vacuolar membrane pq loop repeat protein n=1 Tax=Apiospora aurea TaxID=335848 RepID=A0ABR1QQE9_9PEZI